MANVLAWEGETANEGWNYWEELARAEEAYLESGNKNIFVRALVGEFGFTFAQACARAQLLDDTDGSF